jgi:hypothetical protein
MMMPPMARSTSQSSYPGRINTETSVNTVDRAIHIEQTSSTLILLTEACGAVMLGSG